MDKKLLRMLRGIPASGKTKYAMELVNQGWKRVNKDDLRAMIDASKWSKANERNIVEARNLLVIQYLDEGYNVVVDDTNLPSIHEETLREIAENCDAEFEIKFFDVGVHEAVRRDSLRGDKSVGADVIYRLYRQFLQPQEIPYNKDLPDCYIFDMDGTLALMKDRSPFEWDRVGEDSVNEKVAEMLDNLAQTKKYKIIILSGRDRCCEMETEMWLDDNDIHYDSILMRPIEDKRKDSEVKLELYETSVKGKYNVMGVFDDRDSVVDLWRSLGLTCFQVNYGSF